MVIFGALLGVLNSVLTLAAAETAQGDVLRVPNDTMVAEYEARKAGSSVDEADEGNSRSQGQWLSAARDMQWEKRVALAGGNSSDHQAVLAAFKVGKPGRW
jgi:hypothetical protein